MPTIQPILPDEEAPARAARWTPPCGVLAIPLCVRRPGVVMTTNLPSTYSRSLLKVRVPVTVTLAAKKQSIGKIIELVPGSIIAFDKSCDEMLELEVSGHPIAEGECVKVGDKFGLRVTSLILPDEQLQSLKMLAQKQSSTP